MVVYVAHVEPRNDYTLVITFENSEKRLFDCKRLFDKKVFAPLKNKAFFRLAHVEYGTVVWNESIDIAPEHLYEEGIPL